MMHTTGPWKAIAYPKLTEVQDASGKAVIHWSGFNDSSIPVATHRANARLIAAAPELLEACKELVKLAPFALDNLLPAAPGSGRYQDWDAVNKAVRHAKEIIAKATQVEGGTP